MSSMSAIIQCIVTQDVPVTYLVDKTISRLLPKGTHTDFLKESQCGGFILIYKSKNYLCCEQFRGRIRLVEEITKDD